MLRRRGQKSLYEAVSSAKQGASPDRQPVQPLHPQQSPSAMQQKPPETKIQRQQTVQMPPDASVQKTGWPDKPRLAAFIGERLELSLSIGTIIVAGLVLILLFIVFFRLGQIFGNTGGRQQNTAELKMPPAEGAGLQMLNVNPTIEPPSRPLTTERTSTGSNRIVIKTTPKRVDLEPAKEFFDRNGIETEIVQDAGGQYKLVTKNRSYNNPNVSGTDGFMAMQKIIETGKSYKAPSGFEQFRFEGLYGEKVQ